jgi:hypothetical protein
MRKGFTILLLSVGFALTACNHAKTSEPIKSEYTTNEYDVVSAYLAGRSARGEGKQQASKIVILNTTSSGDNELLGDEGRPVPWAKTAESLRQKAPSLQQTTIDGFRTASARQALLSRAFRIPAEYEIIDSAQLESAFKRGGDWTAYYALYPGSQGYETLSRVGFNADATQALFYASNHCGGMCGGGWYVVMEKRNGRWLTSNEIDMWVS